MNPWQLLRGTPSRSIARGLIIGVLAIDMLFVVVLVADMGMTLAQTSSLDAVDLGDEEQEAILSREALLQLGRELAKRAEEMDRREQEIEELIRGNEVLRRAGLLVEDAATDSEGQAHDAEPAPPEPPKPDPRTAVAFKSLQRAYEKMEPESAASALAELAKRDKEVVVALLLGWNARTSGAILDALTANDPGLAADLSYEIWRMGAEQDS